LHTISPYFNYDLYGMHPVVYSSLKGSDSETVYSTILLYCRLLQNHILLLFTSTSRGYVLPVTDSQLLRLFWEFRYITPARTTQKTVLLLIGADYKENTSHVIAIQPANWRANCCLATSYNIRPLRQSFHYCALEPVYREVAWQCFHQIYCNINA
jgi:hypothetical protein